MKPRTKLQKEVAELSEKLGEISESPKNWAKEHLFARTAYKCKDELCTFVDDSGTSAVTS